jgi:hypothetical protein
MPLSPQDQAFYEEKLSMKNLYYLFGATILMGAIVWPALMYLQDASSGLGARWTLSIAFDWSLIGMMLGSVVSVVMFLGFKFLLTMGWLPARR